MNTISSAYNSMLTLSMPTFTPHCSLVMSLAKSFMNKLKSKGDKGSPCFTPESTLKNLVYTSFNLIHDLESLYRPFIALNILPYILYKANYKIKILYLYNQMLS